MQIFVFSWTQVRAHFCNVLNQLRLSLILVPMFKYLLVLSLLLPTGIVTGQGWERVFDGGGIGQINDIAATPDGGFIMASNYNGISRAHLLKTDADGFLQWTKDYFLDTQTSGEAIAVTKDGGYVISGFQRATLPLNSPRKAYLMKTDAFGEVEWTYVFPGNGNDAEALDVLELPDENAFVVCGYQKNIAALEDFLVFKVDAGGALVWSNTFGAPDIQEKGFALSLDLNGDLLIAGERRDGPSDFYIVHVLTDSGISDWDHTYGFFDGQGNKANDVARDITVTSDGNFVLTGQSNVLPDGVGILMKFEGSGNHKPMWQTNFSRADLFGLAKTADGGFLVTGNRPSTDAQEELFMARVDAEGEKVCQVSVGRPGVDRGYSIVATPDGGAVAAGSGELFVGPFTEESLYMVKMDKNCVVFTSYIAGKIFHDYNTNCVRDANEPGLEDWIVKIESPNYTRYAAARTDGTFEILVDTGTYLIQLFPPNDSWESCDPVITLPVDAFSDTFSIDIPVKAKFACPRNEVDVATPVLRRCANNTYTVRYCNSGTIPSLNTEIEVTLDPDLSFVNSSIPGTPGPNNTYTFNIGFLENGDCGSFTIEAFLNCDATLGEAHCVQSHIFPDSFCNPSTNWDGSIVQARAFCDGDSVRLALANIGDKNMTESVGFVIVEDIILLTAPNDPINRRQLNAGVEEIVRTLPATGKTYRIISEQTSGYPGSSYPTAAVERCLSDTSNVFSTGFYTMFPEDESEPFKAADCQETYDTDYNPDNLKRGHPKGYDVPQYVSPQTDLEYLIQFQNSGTDTVHQVIIRDTLSPYLDPATVHPGAASHPYDFDIYGPGIVQFTLPNLNLPPGSGANEGFVTFRVSQKQEIPCNTEILNSAAIYSDFNAPVLTNQTFHTVCVFDTFVVVKTKHIDFEGADVKVYPNPFDESALFEISGISASSVNLELYDLQGKKVLNQTYNLPSFRLYRHQLPAGMFFYRLITNKGQPIASGKLLVH